jgi:hypothetical protein
MLDSWDFLGALYICVELCVSVAAGASLEDCRVAFGHWSLALVRCGYVLFLDLWSYDVVSLRRCIEAWCLALTGGMEWRDLALGSVVEGTELSVWLTWIIGDYTSG